VFASITRCKLCFYEFRHQRRCLLIVCLSTNQKVVFHNSYVVLENNKNDAIDSFKNAIAYGKIADSSNKNANGIKAEEKSVSGKISRINAIVEGGNTIYYIKLEGVSTIYMVNKSAGVNIVITKEKDEVELKYLDIVDNNIVSVTKFVNKSLK